MLSEAVLSVERTGLPYFDVMVDDSASEQIADQYAEPEGQGRRGRAGRGRRARRPRPSRLAVAQGLARSRTTAKLLRELQKQNKVRLYLVSTRARLAGRGRHARGRRAGAGEAPEGRGRRAARRRLGDGVRQVLTELRGAPPVGDRAADRRPDDRRRAARQGRRARRAEGGAALHRSAWASPEPARDLELTELLVDDVVFVDDLVRFQAKLLARGLRRAGGRRPAQGARRPARPTRTPTRELEIDPRSTRPADGQPQRVELGHRPKETGEITYILEVEPQPRELQTENNRIERTINVRKEKLKVLFVDSEPRYEFRYLKNYLEREETIDLNVVLLSSDPEYSEQDRSALPTFPAAKDELFAYDVVLLGDADPSFLSQSQMQNLAEFVTEKGGGILFIAGESFNPLALPRDAAGAAPADRAGRGPQPDGRRQRDHRRSGPS